MSLLAAIASYDNLAKAYSWLMRRERDYSDSWWELFGDGEEKTIAKISSQLLSGRFKLDAIHEYRWLSFEGETLKSWAWEAIDVLVLRALAQVLTPYLQTTVGLKVSNLKGGGGSKNAVHQIMEQVSNYEFVLKTDVKDFYQSIDHSLLRQQLTDAIEDPQVLKLLDQYLDSSIYFGGVWFSRWGKGISTGCPLASLIGAFYLHSLDKLLLSKNKNNKFFFIRFADDILILTKTRWHLREMIATLNAAFESLFIVKHPNKTFIGRIAKGFDFLGYVYKNGVFKVAKKTLVKCTKKIAQLLEHDVLKYQKNKTFEIGESTRAYIERFLAWSRARLPRKNLLVSPSVMDIKSVFYEWVDSLKESLGNHPSSPHGKEGFFGLRLLRCQEAYDFLALLEGNDFNFFLLAD